ncbi:MAG: hypothetical protein AAGF59_09150 [Pseudomonadota bacterium]
MSRVMELWLCLGLVYALLLAWHQPLRGPLTEAEIRAAFGAVSEEARDSKDPQAQRLLDFFRADDGRPFYMVNLNAVPDSTPETDEAARTYAAFMLPRLLLRASYPVVKTKILGGLNNSLDPGIDRAEHLIVVRYRSRRDFLNIIATSDFRSALEHKHTSLDGWYAAPAFAGPVFSIPQFALIGLMAIGAIGTVLGRRSHTRLTRQPAQIPNA